MVGTAKAGAPVLDPTCEGWGWQHPHLLGSVYGGPARGDAGRPGARRVGARLPKKASLPASWSAISLVRNRRRNSLPRTRTGRRNAGREDIQRCSIECDAAAGHDHVHVGMVRQCRSPGVEHGGDADPRDRGGGDRRRS